MMSRARFNVVGGDGYRRWQQVFVEIDEVRQEEPVERCDELEDEVSMKTSWRMQSTGDDEQYVLGEEKWRSSGFSPSAKVDFLGPRKQIVQHFVSSNVYVLSLLFEAK
ncbi:hypothetical protein CEXT_1241 [Caerostris extrusa]|uniref:Uncharacterized protein n=1 Tax=Caerostris extrusa TaxID=172846 RepID=A0AAV4USR0_CAEEX|nr:hypothetical protein CEXT_1241 [Caerostris extrusa]